MTEHINKQYDQDLEAIRSRMMQMGGLVESNVRAAVEAYLTGDVARATEMIGADRKVNELECAVDNELGQIVVRRQPAASDLRLILAASKIVTDLERIGDEAAKIARMVRELGAGGASAAPQLPRRVPVAHIADVATNMLRRALDAFARLDAVAAARVCAEDQAIDDEFQAVLRQVITFMMEDPRTITTSMQVVWVAKALERIGDHAKNVAEYVIYIVKGRDVRHIPLAELEKEALGR